MVSVKTFSRRDAVQHKNDSYTTLDIIEWLWCYNRNLSALLPKRTKSSMSNISENQQRKLPENVQFGKYNVIAKIASGGMAELFLARKQDLAGIGRKVVLKHILPHLSENKEFIQMFLDEARVTSQLNHPNIVQIYEVGQYAEIYYIAMEYIQGKNLRDFKKKVYNQSKYKDKPPFHIFAGIFAQAATGLHHAHKACDDFGNPLGIIHRDISPNNLLISYAGTVKVLDFGVAKAETQEHKTRVGNLKGRLSYMSPEQLRGAVLTPQSDVFALGVVLYELSTNTRLFKRKTEQDTAKAVLRSSVEPPTSIWPDYPPKLEEIVLKAIERDLDKRYQSADELRKALEQFMQQEQQYCGAPHIAELMDYLFTEEKLSGLPTLPSNQSGLQLLAQRTGAYQAITRSSLAGMGGMAGQVNMRSMTPPAARGIFPPPARPPNPLGPIHNQANEEESCTDLNAADVQSRTDIQNRLEEVQSRTDIHISLTDSSDFSSSVSLEAELFDDLETPPPAWRSTPNPHHLHIPDAETNNDQDDEPSDIVKTVIDVAHPPKPQKSGKAKFLIFLVVLTCIAGAAFVLWWNPSLLASLTHSPPPKKDKAFLYTKNIQVINSYIKEGKYKEAKRNLRKLKTQAAKQLSASWVSNKEKIIELGTGINHIDILLQDKQLKDAKQHFAQIRKEHPDAKVLLQKLLRRQISKSSKNSKAFWEGLQQQLTAPTPKRPSDTNTTKGQEPHQRD